MNLSLGDTRLIIDTCKKYGLLRNQCAYVLATAYHETAHTMKPVRETRASSDASAKAILTKAFKAGKLPWVTKDYWTSGYFGRGYSQLTHYVNYLKAGTALGVNLVGNPSLALEPVTAANVIVLGMKEGWFTNKRLSEFVTLQKSNFFDARSIINGDKNKPVKKGSKETIGQMIAGYAKQYDALLKAEGYGETGSSLEETQPWTPPPPPQPIPSKPVVVHVDPDGSVKPGKSPVKTVERNPIWAAFLAILKAIFRRGK